MAFRPPTPSEVTLAVLAGGEGTRMGMAKGLLQIAGRPILDYLLDRLQWPGPTALITAPGREHPPGWQRFDCEWVDPVAGLGPLRGALTALENARTDWIVAVPVDMPAIGRDAIDRLLGCASEGERGTMYEHQSADNPRVIEPFPLLVRKSSAGIMGTRLARRELSLVKLLDEPGFATHHAPAHWSDETWINLNRREDLERFGMRD